MFFIISAQKANEYDAFIGAQWGQAPLRPNIQRTMNHRDTETGILQTP
jgi:hypothetical protein